MLMVKIEKIESETAIWKFATGSNSSDHYSNPFLLLSDYLVGRFHIHYKLHENLHSFNISIPGRSRLGLGRNSQSN